MTRLTLLSTLFALAACGGAHQGGYEIAASGTTVANVDEARAAADALWAQRSDAAKLKEALAAYEQLVSANPADRESLIRLTRGYYFLGDGHLTDNAEKLAAWDKSIKWGKSCLALNAEFTALLEKGDETEASAARVLTADDAPCLYWTATSLGKWARLQGLGVVLANKDTVFAWMQRVEALTPDYFYGACNRYWGAYYSALPSYAGQDLPRSQASFEKSIATEPNYFGTRVLYAEYWAVRTQNKQVFEENLNFVINGDPSVLPEIQAEQEAEQRKAKALLANMSELFAD